jgi:rare lipoprotein A
MRLPANHAVPLAILLLGGGAVSGLQEAQARPAAPVSAAVPTGPAADYPVTVGAPYTIGTTTWTPADQLNYDAVGYAGSSATLTGVSGAHKTLPLPSYAEVTALDSGHTILVRLVERGPQDNDTLVALSTAAAAQLGIVAGSHTAVRVRRVNPPEIERAALRTGGTAPMRMETPEALLKVLRRKLADQSPLMPPPSVPPAMPASIVGDGALPASSAPRSAVAPPQKLPTSSSTQTTAAPAPSPKKTAAAAKPASTTNLPTSVTVPKSTSAPHKAVATTKAPEPAARGTHIVQVATFSSSENAEKAARRLGGAVTPAGKLWRVRLGPFAGAKEASSALEKAKAAGYSDARIQRTQ